jgi:hypothetical protein
VPGLSMGSSATARLSAAASSGTANYGSTAGARGGNAPATVSTAAFGPSASGQAGSKYAGLSPSQPTGLAFWVGVGAIVALVIIRQSLPR